MSPRHEAPHNPEAEDAVLGAVLVDPAAWSAVSGILTADDFYRPANGHLFQVLAELHSNGGRPDPVTVGEELERRSWLDEVGGHPRLIELAQPDRAPVPSNAGKYARVVAEASTRRRVMGVGAELTELGRRGGDLGGALATAAARLDDAVRATRTLTLSFTTLRTFSTEEEAGAEALLGDNDEAVIAAGATVMAYGKGGAGKTTLLVDGGFHLATGIPWLGIPVRRPVTCALIENEGPRPWFRKKLDQKLKGWKGDDPGQRIQILDEPWGVLDLGNVAHRVALAEELERHEVEVAVLGPLTALGMTAPGTLTEARAFIALLDDVRQRAGRAIAFVVVHHENRAGQVSGAFEPVVDTLLHVSGQGHGHTRLHFEKARWSPGHHATTLTLRWADAQGFVVEQPPERTDEDIAEAIQAAILTSPGVPWSEVEKQVPGVKRERRMAIRDRLFADRKIVNIVGGKGREQAVFECGQGQRTRLFVQDDPGIRPLLFDGEDRPGVRPLVFRGEQLLPDPGEVGEK